ncbi:unnamed protein product [Gordionus sp. m RMFG-2023]
MLTENFPTFPPLTTIKNGIPKLASPIGATSYSIANSTITTNDRPKMKIRRMGTYCKYKKMREKLFVLWEHCESPYELSRLEYFDIPSLKRRKWISSHSTTLLKKLHISPSEPKNQDLVTANHNNRISELSNTNVSAEVLYASLVTRHKLKPNRSINLKDCFNVGPDITNTLKIEDKINNSSVKKVLSDKSGWMNGSGLMINAFHRPSCDETTLNLSIESANTTTLPVTISSTEHNSTSAKISPPVIKSDMPAHVIDISSHSTLLTTFISSQTKYPNQLKEHLLPAKMGSPCISTIVKDPIIKPDDKMSITYSSFVDSFNSAVNFSNTLSDSSLCEISTIKTGSPSVNSTRNLSFTPNINMTQHAQNLSPQLGSASSLLPYCISIYGQDPYDCLTFQLGCQKEMDDWLQDFYILHQLARQKSLAFPLRPAYESVWRVSLKARGIVNFRLSGDYFLGLSSGEELFSLFKYNQYYDTDDEENDSIKEFKERYYSGDLDKDPSNKLNVNAFQRRRDVQIAYIELCSIKRCGYSNSYFYVELGRTSSLGTGELWMRTENESQALSIHTLLLQRMSFKKSYETPVNRPSIKPVSNGDLSSGSGTLTYLPIITPSMKAELRANVMSHNINPLSPILLEEQEKIKNGSSYEHLDTSMIHPNSPIPFSNHSNSNSDRSRLGSNASVFSDAVRERSNLEGHLPVQDLTHRLELLKTYCSHGLGRKEYQKALFSSQDSGYMDMLCQQNNTTISPTSDLPNPTSQYTEMSHTLHTNNAMISTNNLNDSNPLSQNLHDISPFGNWKTSLDELTRKIEKVPGTYFDNFDSSSPRAASFSVNHPLDKTPSPLNEASSSHLDVAKTRQEFGISFEKIRDLKRKIGDRTTLNDLTSVKNRNTISRISGNLFPAQSAPSPPPLPAFFFSTSVSSSLTSDNNSSQGEQVNHSSRDANHVGDLKIFTDVLDDRVRAYSVGSKPHPPFNFLKRNKKNKKKIKDGTLFKQYDSSSPITSSSTTHRCPIIESLVMHNLDSPKTPINKGMVATSFS